MNFHVCTDCHCNRYKFRSIIAGCIRISYSLTILKTHCNSASRGANNKVIFTCYPVAISDRVGRKKHMVNFKRVEKVQQIPMTQHFLVCSHDANSRNGESSGLSISLNSFTFSAHTISMPTNQEFPALASLALRFSSHQPKGIFTSR